MRYFRDKTISISIIFPGYFDTDRMRYTARHPDDITCNYTRLCSVGFVDFGVRVWESYRTSRSFGYRYGSVIEFTEAPGNVARAYRTHRSSGYGYYCHTELTEVPGTDIIVIQDSRECRVLVFKSYKTFRSSGYCGTGVQNLQKFREGISMLYPYPDTVSRAYISYRSSGHGYDVWYG